MEQIDFRRVLNPIAKGMNEILNKKKKAANKKGNIKEKKKIVKKINGFLSSSDRHIGEMIKPKTGRSYFAVYNPETKNLTYRDKIETDNTIYFPDWDDGLISLNIIKMPGCVEKYHSRSMLIDDLRDYIDKYVDIQDKIYKEIIIAYILLTWVYDRFSALPYLRIIGEMGTGKSRLLDILAGVCYKALKTASLASAAPIFRVIDKFYCTLLIDEVELSNNSERNCDIKEVLRFGKDKNGAILRVDNNTNKTVPYIVFGPKIFSSKYSTGDDALESRVISIRMQYSESKKIPLQLEDEELKKDSELLRAKLLAYRLKNYYKIDTRAYMKYIDSSVYKRLNEMIAPLICVRDGDESFISGLIGMTREKHRNMMEDKSMSFEAEIIKAMYMVQIEEKGDPLVQDIADRINDESHKKYSSRFIASILRENFKMSTMHTRDGNAVIYEKGKVLKLIENYNLTDLTKITSISPIDKIWDGINRNVKRLKRI